MTVGELKMHDCESASYNEQLFLGLDGIHPVIMDALNIQRLKGADYNGPMDVDPAKREYFPYGHHSYLHMLHTKIRRLEQVTIKDNRRIPNFESAYDSVLDLINYASFYGAYLKELENEPDGSE